jgi:hypothetical protein
LKRCMRWEANTRSINHAPYNAATAPGDSAFPYTAAVDTRRRDGAGVGQPSRSQPNTSWQSIRQREGSHTKKAGMRVQWQQRHHGHYGDEDVGYESRKGGAKVGAHSTDAPRPSLPSSTNLHVLINSYGRAAGDTTRQTAVQVQCAFSALGHRQHNV